jgi:hypothetical protein
VADDHQAVIAEALIDALVRQRDALATQLAIEWGWGTDREAVLTRLTGNLTAALTTFSDAALVVLAASPTDRQAERTAKPAAPPANPSNLQDRWGRPRQPERTETARGGFGG